MRVASWFKSFAENDYRRSLILAHVGWWGTAIIIVLRAFERIPQSLGSTAILTLGFAVAASLSLSRMRLGRTVSQVFQTGLSLAVSLTTSGPTEDGDRPRAAVFRTDLEGVIKSCERTDVVGWPEEQSGQLEGRAMDTLIPDRFLSLNHAALTQYRQASAGGTDEVGVVVAFNVPLRGFDGKERAFRMTIARLGDTLIKTLVPISDTLSSNLNLN